LCAGPRLIEIAHQLEEEEEGRNDIGYVASLQQKPPAAYTT